jgi:hypothetical protein
MYSSVTKGLKVLGIDLAKVIDGIGHRLNKLLGFKPSPPAARVVASADHETQQPSQNQAS